MQGSLFQRLLHPLNWTIYRRTVPSESLPVESLAGCSPDPDQGLPVRLNFDFQSDDGDEDDDDDDDDDFLINLRTFSQEMII
ncbi:uncharacterized protein N7458_011213 [Penicillium daleae]|uniref:Uncharacterized protein n=1 Tax=Penicillium daleae TaxID=63821 RepID=A0AAD6G040_9EURO|nr:uncharacterized protein N7458_011213 [Penicillium daleae]KAJ5440215.1 hypothetical protein N7458_011213 [Penicillium daleae]